MATAAIVKEYTLTGLKITVAGPFYEKESRWQVKLIDETAQAANESLLMWDTHTAKNEALKYAKRLHDALKARIK